MGSSLSFRKGIVVFGTPISIFGLLYLITKIPDFTTNADMLSIGITFDLLITAPLVYFLLIRKTKIPKTSVVPFLVLGLLIGFTILPEQNQYYLKLFKSLVLPVIEIGILSYVIYNLRKATVKFKSHKKGSIDFYDTLKTTCKEILPKALVMPMVTEIAVFYYAFIHWKKRRLNKNEFSYHRESGTISLLIAIIFVVGIETVVLHILLAKWSIVAAWILSFLSIYSGIQLLGILKSMTKRPISLNNEVLHLRYGFVSETTIVLKDIEKIELSSKELDKDPLIRKLSFLGELESHNALIHLKKENTIIGFYGIKRKYKTLALHVDDGLKFANQIKEAISKSR